MNAPLPRPTPSGRAGTAPRPLAAVAGPVAISDREFVQFQRFIHEAAGIALAPAKQALVSGRLAKRLRQHGLDSFGAYFRLLQSGKAPGETQVAIDLLTTNETYFFREPRHFDLLRQHAAATRRRTDMFRVWSAASSSGEEAYSIAMTLAEALNEAPWEVVGTDISTRVLEQARRAHYPVSRCRNIPAAFLRRYCLRGVGEEQGSLLVDRALRGRVRFLHANLNAALPALGSFDAIFLRNVMIYFNADTKRRVLERALAQLKRGGHLYIGHAESLGDMAGSLEMLAPSSYRKP